MNNLIGVSGKIGSGKDLIGNIIQYLEVAKHPSGEDYDAWRHRGGFANETPTYQIKKYADKLKDMVCLLISCTREQLEDREFKFAHLGEEWDCFITFSEPTWNYKLNATKQGVDLEYIRHINPRLLLQLLGTECGRQILHPNIWVNALFADYKNKEEIGLYDGGYLDGQEAYRVDKSNWIITDVRFPNEAKAIKDRGGIVIRVDRLKSELSLFNASQHESETALDDYEFDYVIDNDGSIEELVEKVKQLKL
jgi:hypothetical protein